jgi:hypothetical protein
MEIIIRATFVQVNQICAHPQFSILLFDHDYNC